MCTIASEDVQITPKLTKKMFDKRRKNEFILLSALRTKCLALY